MHQSVPVHCDMTGKTETRSAHFWQRLQAVTALKAPADVEDSLWLRILTQLLVSVGILATDIAAETHLSLWAIPCSVVGAIWSGYRRRQPNVLLKGVIAILMVLALVNFFTNLWGQLNDTRLALVELLVQLQVLHSFDIPRRKDLGYSMVIGFILIGVASTLSQTMTFGLFLLIFLVIALPVLVLDYRSRLGIKRPHDERFSWPTTGLDPRRLGGYLLATLGLGLALFALMPRLPAYQLQTFPVSAPIQGQFSDTTQILNPGYVRTGTPRQEGGTGTGTGEGDTGSGMMDNTSYYGFNTRMNQNLRGQMKPRVVMRVRSQVEGFWRVLAFDRYLGQGWEISRNDQTKTVERSSWSYQFYLPRLVLTFGKKKDVVQTYTVVSELPNLMPALHQPKVLYFPTQQVAIDPDGNLRAPLPLMEGLTYTVISEVPYRDRSLLRQSSNRYPEAIKQAYLQVPSAIQARVRRQTEAMLARAPKPLTAPSEKALFLAQELKQRYTIQPDLPPLEAQEDLVEAFLFKYKGGYPDHFSTVLTVMLRSIGIPARLITGFGPGTFNPFTGLYIVQNTDAYAITDVYFPGFGWFAFDPIPGHPLVPPSLEEEQSFTVLQQFWKWVAGWLPSPIAGFLTQLFDLIGQGVSLIISGLLRLLAQGWLGLVVLTVGAIASGLLGWLIWQGWKTWRYRRWLAQLPPVESLYQQMLQVMARRGLPKHPAQTPLEYAQQTWTQQPPQQAAAIEEITQAYVRWRYGGHPANLNFLQQLLKRLTSSRCLNPGGLRQLLVKRPSSRR